MESVDAVESVDTVEVDPPVEVNPSEVVVPPVVVEVDPFVGASVMSEGNVLPVEVDPFDKLDDVDPTVVVGGMSEGNVLPVAADMPVVVDAPEEGIEEISKYIYVYQFLMNFFLCFQFLSTLKRLNESCEKTDIYIE